MAVGHLTSSTLIDTIKRENLIPASQSTYTDADFLAIANQEIRIGLVPSILQYHQEYYARDSAPVAIVSNQSNYAVPYRAVGGKLREVFYQDTNGNLRSMSRISPDDRPYYQQTNFQNRFIYFFMEGNEVVIVPPVGVNPVGSLVFSYYFRPNDLVDESRVSTILGISVGASTTVYTVDSIPTSVTAFIQDGVSLTGFSLSSKLDILQTRPGHKTISFDIIPTAIDTTNKTITFNNSDINTGVIVGDYIAFAGECVIPQIPADLHDVLAQRVGKRCLEGLGDAQGVGIAAARLQEMEKNTGNLVDNRIEGSPIKINNTGSVLRSSKIRRRGWL